MGTAEDGGTQARRRSTTPPPDRRAEALRANLKRRKAQTRARSEARPDGAEAPTDAADRDG